MGLADGWMGTAWASASEAPQNRQNCAVCSEAPRQREQRRCIAGAGLTPSSTTRTGAMGGGVGVGGGGADENRGGCSGTVRERSAVPVGPRGIAAGTGGGLAASRWPQVTQKRRPRWFELPQSGQGLMGTGVAGGGSPRGAKLTWGAGGRWSGTPGTELRCPCGAGAGGTGAGCAMGGGGFEGASAVAASEAGTFSGARGASPIGGVGGATRGASL
jgi:hypothetical protein